jgi:hypothetical protein
LFSKFKDSQRSSRIFKAFLKFIFCVNIAISKMRISGLTGYCRRSYKSVSTADGIVSRKAIKKTRQSEEVNASKK